METRTKTQPPDGSISPLADTDLAHSSGDIEPSTPSEPDLTGRRISHFVLLKQLGQGGMGIVYAAEDTLLHRKVALKILPAAVSQNPERRRRFLREGRAASAVDHPTIATIFEVGEDGEHVYLAMELVAGKTLRQILDEKDAPLDIPEAVRITVEIARGLEKAHQTGIIHRDLKPENIMLGEDGAPKILDFGLAKHRAAENAFAPTATDLATVEGRILGTPGYMSPEQSKGKPVDARTDLFALGVLLYELLTRERPFRGSTAVEVLIAVDRDPHPPPSAKNPRVPPELDRFVARCLEKRPDDRFATCRELILALSSISLDNTKTNAIPAAPPEAARLSALSTEPQKSPSLRTRRLWFGVALGAIGIGVAIAVVRVAPWSMKDAADKNTKNDTKNDTKNVAPEISSIAAATPPPRRPCREGEPGLQKCLDKNVIPWCDLRGVSIACCGSGLVPTGTDGICGCAPGGTHIREVLAGGCHEPPVSRAEAHQHAKAKAVDGAIACFKPFFEAGKTNNGRFAADYALTPEGEVIEARVQQSTMPQQEAQACALNILRSTRFPPPKAEEAGTILGFGFEFGEVDKTEKKQP